ncbi:Hypothetical protein PP7435_CHR1-1194 [Komagataella phaffii CBS 7435]|uniref:Proteasome assembly chaperone 1 n=2 Tax=Komagataella phaffii TaxID=460519 RepID=C4QYC9_KOMPG|nr:Hypothetical protein PAS_chr1-4_0404 [Komagataella phaffii GS115]CAH2447075.1 Hypothetical protein BQ9382_C1-6285 [Komagataella phaffii CBS 7435]CAY68252.1 Hypothetical protein PAS_chr1-4_0404 [Komagataella phaffii GS115]SCV11909.1 Hypothetical protein PP7435_CHR1-1194 [Komagataella phaffii CBS 7435]
MLIKPWAETIPRHELAEELEDELPIEPVLSYSQIETPTHNQFLIIGNSNFNTILNSFDKLTEYATISIDYNSSNSKNDDDDFHEDEQLYQINKQSVFEPKTITVYRTVNNNNQNVLLVSVPLFANIYTYNVLAKFLLVHLNSKQILVLGSSQLENELLAKLATKQDSELDPKLKQIAQLKPPSFVTGIAASLLSTGKTLHKDMVALLLDGDGPIDYERLNENGLNACTSLLGQVVHVDLNRKKSLNRPGLYL